MNHKDVSNEIWKFENFENYFFKFGSRCILIKLYTQEFESHLPRFKLCFSYCVGFGLGFLFESQRDYWLSISLRLDSTELNQIMFSLHMSESPSEHPSLPLQAILNLNLPSLISLLSDFIFGLDNFIGKGSYSRYPWESRNLCNFKIVLAWFHGKIESWWEKGRYINNGFVEKLYFSIKFTWENTDKISPIWGVHFARNRIINNDTFSSNKDRKNLFLCLHFSISHSASLQQVWIISECSKFRN